MKPKKSAFLAASLTLSLAAPSLHAASATWNGTTDALWATPTNWSAAVPGTGDTATFDNAGGAVDTINLGASAVTVNSVVFDTANAAAYTIGAAATPALVINAGGSIIMNDTVANNQTFASNVDVTNTVNSTYTITNNSTTNSLNFNSFYAGGAGTTGVTVNVVNAGTINANRIFKAGNAFTLNKSGIGTLNLDGTADNAWMDFILNDGTVVMNKTGLASGRAANTATVNGGTLIISGTQEDQINSSLTVNGGIVDMNGKNEGLTQIAGTGGTIYNTANATTSTITLTTTSATYAGVIADNAGDGQTGIVALTKNGTGTIQRLSGINTYTGATTVSNGTLSFANTAAKSAGTTTTVADLSTAILGLGVGGTGFFSAADVDSLYANTLAGVTMNTNSGVGIDVTAGDFTYASDITGSRNLAVSGGKTLFLTGNNSGASGNTIVTGGGTLLAIEDTNALPGYSTAGRWSVAGSSGLVVGNAVSDADCAIMVGLTNLAVNANVGFDTSAGDRTFALDITVSGSGNIGLFKIGNNTLTLSGNNTFTGQTGVLGGTLKLGSATALGSNGAAQFTFVGANATVDLNGQTTAEPFGSGARHAFADTAALTNSSNTTAEITGNVAFMGNSSTNFTVSGVGDIILNQTARALVGAGTNIPRLIKTGNNTLTMNGTTDNAFLNLTLTSGTVVMNKTAASVRAFSTAIVDGGLLQFAGTNSDQINSSLTVNGGIVDMNGRNEGLSVIAGTGGTIYNTANTTTSLITLTNGTADYAGVIADNAGGGQTGKVALTKSGTGTQTLSGINTYTGDTTVTNGILTVTAPNFGNASTVTLGSAAMLALPNEGTDIVGSLVIGGIPQEDGLYTFGTGKLQVGGSNPYTTWAGSAVFDADANNDGVSNGLAWIIGAGSPTDNAALGLLPQPVQSGGNLTLTFTQVNPIAPNQLFVEYSSDLGITDPWHRVAVPADDDTVDGVIFDITTGTPNSGVTLTIPVSKAAGGGKLFSRLVGVQN